MATHPIPFTIVAKDNAQAVLERVRVAVIDARGDQVDVVGQVMEFEMPEGAEWPQLPEIGEDGRSHYMESSGPGEAHCLPECWCQSGEDV